MKIKELFRELKEKSNSKETASIFENSGMVNEFLKLDLGFFFPIGSGILTDIGNTEEAEITEGGVMILGNDFGTVTFFDTDCKKKKGGESPTLRNLKKLNLNPKETFFTNFYLGLRNDKIHSGTTMTKRVEPLKEDYKSFCFNFFLIQLKLANPRIVICLGHEVRKSLTENKSELFSKWRGNGTTIKKLFANDDFQIPVIDKELGNRKFIISPHPCDSRNFNDDYIKKIIEELNK